MQAFGRRGHLVGVHSNAMSVACGCSRGSSRLKSAEVAPLPRGISPQLAYWIDFNSHLTPTALGLPVTEAAAAAMYGLSLADYEPYLASVREEVNARAEVLLTRPLWPEAIDHLPVPRGGTLLAIGDSITTYRHGYVELLRALLARRRPEDGVRVLNRGYSGYTSAQGLAATYSYFLGHRPDLVFIGYGGNDCKRFGQPPGKTLVSIEEFAANMEAIIAAFQTLSKAHLVLLTPAPVIESVVNPSEASVEYASRRMTWSNADVESFAQVVRDLGQRQGLPVVDLVAAFGREPDSSLYLPDGLHPNLEGQQIVLELALRAAAGPGPDGRWVSPEWE